MTRKVTFWYYIALVRLFYTSIIKKRFIMVDIKYFTPKEANKTLPLVKQIVKDILNSTREMRLIAEDVNGKVEDNPQILALASDITGFMQELEELGCEYKDWNFTIGLVDFPAIIDGEEVYLCWRTDEDEIRYYHRKESGYEGRRSIPLEYL
jgi:hypothetical protein